MQIKLINCDTNLKANFGIDMQEIGSYDKLCSEMKAKITFLVLEYDFAPLDCILLEVADGTVIPDLSLFGEVQPFGDSMG